MKYYFAEGTRFEKENAQVVGDYLYSKFPDQELKRKDVVDLARPRTSPLHKYFEWNDTLAAEKYRRVQAGKLIQALYIKVEDKDIRAYESVRVSVKDRSYVGIDKIASNEDLWQQVVETAKREILYWETKYSLYKNNFPKIFSAIKELKEEQAYGKDQKGGKSARGNNTNSSDRVKNSRRKNSRNDAAAS